MEFMEHPDPEVRRALVRLVDALATWERSTEIQSVLILREAGGFTFRAVNGKPVPTDDVTDDQLMKVILGK